MPAFRRLVYNNAEDAAAIPRPEDFTSRPCCFCSISTSTLYFLSSSFIPCQKKNLHAVLASFQRSITIFTLVTDRNNCTSANLRSQQYVFIFRWEPKVHFPRTAGGLYSCKEAWRQRHRCPRQRLHWRAYHGLPKRARSNPRFQDARARPYACRPGGRYLPLFALPAKRPKECAELLARA